ncbi:MAG TPA: hypothetical protein VMD91_02980 [Candidatus Sulfotelmatobacter sp.]|nr:hypothetical protein [Candidatus Sulfotelmatobacter sp.]
MSRTLALVAFVAVTVLGAGGIVALAQSTQSTLRGGGGMRAIATPAAAPSGGPTAPPLPLGDMRRKGHTSVSGQTVFDPLGWLQRLPQFQRKQMLHRLGPRYAGQQPAGMPKLGPMLRAKQGIRHSASATGASIVLTGTATTQAYLDDQTVAYGADVYWECENLKANTTYEYIVFSPDGFAYTVGIDEYWAGNANSNTFTTDATGRCEHTAGGEMYPYWAAITLTTPLAATNATILNGPDTNAAASAYSGIWAIAVKNTATGNFEAVAYTVVIGTLNFSTYSNAGMTTVANDFASGSTAYVQATGLNPAHFYDFGFINTSGNGLPCVYTIPSGTQNYNNAVCFTNGAAGVLPTNQSFSGQWTTPASGTNAAGTYSVELYDATTNDMISQQQVSVNPSTLTWNTLVPYSSTSGTGTNLNNIFATDGLFNVQAGIGNVTTDQSVTGLNISGSGTTSGHVYSLTLSNGNGVVLASTTSDTGTTTFPESTPAGPQFFNPPLSFTATGTTFTENNVAFPLNTATLTSFGASQTPFAPNVYTAQLYDSTAGTVVGSKSFQIVSYSGSFEWTSPAGSFVNANAGGLATNVTATLTNTGGTLFGTWNADGIKQVTIERDSTAKVTMGLQTGVTTATDSQGQTWNLTTYTDAITGAPGVKAVPAVAGESLAPGSTLPFPLTVGVATGNCTAACILRTTITPLHGIAESITSATMANTATNGLEVLGFSVAANQPSYSWTTIGDFSGTQLGTPRYTQAMYVSGTDNALSTGTYPITVTVNNTGGSAAINALEFVMPATYYPSTSTPKLTSVVNNGNSQVASWTVYTEDGGNGATANANLGSNAFAFDSGSKSIAVGQTAVFQFTLPISLASFPFQVVPVTANWTGTSFTVGPTSTLTNAIAGTTNVLSDEIGVFSLNPAFMTASITPAVVAASAGSSFTFAFTNTSTGLDPNPDYVSQLLIEVPSMGGVYPSSVSVTSPNQTGVTWHANATSTTGTYLIDLCTSNTIPSVANQTYTACTATQDANSLPPGDTLDVTFTYATAPGVATASVPWIAVGANGGAVVGSVTTPINEEPTLAVANTTAQTSITYAGGYTATPVYPPVAPITAVPANSQPTIGAWANYNDGNGYVFQLYNNGSTPITDVSIQIPSSNTSGQIFDTQDWSVIASSIYTYGAGAAGAQCSANGYKTLTEPVRGSPGTPGIITLHGCTIAVGQSLDVFFYALSPYDIGSTFLWPASVADNGTPANPNTNANTLAAYSLSNTVRVIDEAELSIQVPTGVSPTFTYNPALFGPSDAPTVSCPNCTFTSGTVPIINLNSITGTFDATDTLAASVYSDSTAGWTLYVAADQNPQISSGGGPALNTWIDKTASSHPGTGTFTPNAAADTSPGVVVPTTGTQQLSTFTGAALHTPVDNIMSFQLNVGATVLSATQTNTITLTYTLIAN